MQPSMCQLMSSAKPLVTVSMLTGEQGAGGGLGGGGKGDGGCGGAEGGGVNGGGLNGGGRAATTTTPTSKGIVRLPIPGASAKSSSTTPSWSTLIEPPSLTLALETVSECAPAVRHAAVVLPLAGPLSKDQAMTCAGKLSTVTGVHAIWPRTQ